MEFDFSGWALCSSIFASTLIEGINFCFEGGYTFSSFRPRSILVFPWLVCMGHFRVLTGDMFTYRYINWSKSNFIYIICKTSTTWSFSKGSLNPDHTHFYAWEQMEKRILASYLHEEKEELRNSFVWDR